jgi:type I restriction enzyme S subunit
MRSGFPKINRDKLGEYLLALPPTLEQDSIASVPLDHDDREGREEEGIAKLRTLKNGLMDVLLTGRVRVKVAGEDARW